jgi:hypothetical protein
MAPSLQQYLQPIQVTTYRFSDDGSIPNNPTLPFLVYPGVLHFGTADPAVVAEQGGPRKSRLKRRSAGGRGLSAGPGRGFA